MIQQHIVFHYTSFDDGVTYYEANQQAAYYLVRSGKILELLEDRLGGYAAKVMSAIIYLGHAQVSDLEVMPELGQSVSNGEANGTANGTADGTADRGLHATLKALAAHRYIHRVRDAHFQSYTDTALDAERVVQSRPEIKALKGKKLEETVIEKTLDLVRERTDGDLSRGLTYNGVPRGLNKKRTSHADDEENEWSDDEGDTPMDVSLYPPVKWDETDGGKKPGVVVRINYTKLDVALRNRRFISLAEHDSSSPVTAEVYEALLRRIEYQTPTCRDSVEIPREGEEGEQYSVPISLSAIAEDIDPQLDLSGSIGPMDMSMRRKRPLDDDHEANGNGNNLHELDQHLSLLAQPPHNLTSKRTIGGLPTWTVEFRHLARTLRHLDVEQLIEARYGDVALRVIRVLQAKGKLDEKRLQEISLLPFKDLRQVLASMQAGGFVDLQEVPRDAQRQPSRTIYLWFHDADRICASVIEDIYKAMAACLRRLKSEREQLKEFLEKTERSDVKGNEERYLSEGELRSLSRWRDKEALLLGEVSRLDDMVAVIRDY